VIVVKPVPAKDEFTPFPPLEFELGPAVPPAPTVIVYVVKNDNVIADSADAPPPDVPAEVLKPPAPPPPARL
jgi:hypothetical protein